MKIAFVLDDSLDPPDGVQQYVLLLGRELSSRGHSVHYLVGETSRRDIDHVHSLATNVQVKFNQNRARMPLPANREAIRHLLRTENFDVIHVQAPYSPLLAGRIINAAPARARIVATWHIAANSKFVELANRGLRMFNARTLQKIDSHIAVSTAAADFARSVFRVPSAVIPCPIDLHNFAHAAASRAAGRVADPQGDALVANEKSRNKIVFLGRLVGRKGPDKLLRAIRFAERQDLLPSNTHVVIGGDGSMRRELEQFAKTLKTPIEFVGTVTEQPKPEFLAAADVAVFPSLAGETFGIVLAEAMAAGSGVVLAGDNPGYRSTMADYEDVLFDPDDVEGFAKKISQALCDAPYIARVHEWQSQHVLQYDVGNVVDRVLAVYDPAATDAHGHETTAVRSTPQRVRPSSVS